MRVIVAGSESESINKIAVTTFLEGLYEVLLKLFSSSK